MTSSSSRFLTPAKAGDVFVLLGSGEKRHVIARDEIREALYTVARCGRRGRKVRIADQHVLPPNQTERYSVCVDCREFTRGVPEEPVYGPGTYQIERRTAVEARRSGPHNGRSPERRKAERRGMHQIIGEALSEEER